MKMLCHTIERHFSDYMDESLSARQRDLVDSHLRACGICRHELDALRRTRALFEEFYTVPDAPEGYYARFTENLQHRVEGMFPMALPRRVCTMVSHLTGLLLMQAYRCFVGIRGIQAVLITNRTLPLYVLTVLMTTLCIAALLLTNESPLPPESMQATAIVQGKGMQLVVVPPESLAKGNRRVSHGLQERRTEETTLETKTSTPQPVNVWRITDVSIGEGTTRFLTSTANGTGDDGNASSDSELLVIAEIPTGSLSLRPRGMLLQEDTHGLLLARGIRSNGDDPVLHRYERKQRDSLGNGLQAWLEQMGFARKLVLLETLSLTDVYDSI